MKSLLAAGAMGALLISVLPSQAAIPSFPNSLPDQSLAASIGQPVYDLNDNLVGTVKGITDANGEPSAIVSPSRTFEAERYLLLPGDSMGPRADGGWLVALSDFSVANLRPYVPGEPVPLY